MSKFISGLWIIVFFLALFPEYPVLADAVPAQLNPGTFAYCLTQAETGPAKSEMTRTRLKQIRRWHRLHVLDGLLVFLSVYPGVRLPGTSYWIQQPAQRRWSDSRNRNEQDLALRFLRLSERGKPLVPVNLFAEALKSCGRAEPFCASLLTHNVLRTLGRYENGIYVSPITGEETDYNPAWFRQDQPFWQEKIPALQQSLAPLRPDGAGDRWGEWYHFFGIFAFALHEAAIGMPVQSVEFAVRMNKLLNPLLAGENEEPEKARLDRDSVRVARHYLSRHYHHLRETPVADCDDISAYVAAQ